MWPKVGPIKIQVFLAICMLGFLAWQIDSSEVRIGCVTGIVGALNKLTDD